MKKIVVLIFGLLLAGCASAPTPQKETFTAKKVEPTYFEKVNGESLALWKSSTPCPKSETTFATSGWRQMAAMAASCTKAQDWNMVDLLGNAIAKKGHTAPWGPYYMALAAEARKDFPRAVWMVELALKKAPNEGILHYELGRIRWIMGDDIMALKSLKQASEFNPSLIDAHWITGMVALNGDKFSEAEGAFNRALAVDSRHWPSIMALAEVKMRSKDWERAEGLLERAISMNSRSTKARVALASVQETQLKKVQEALDSYKDLKRLNASNKLDSPLNFNIDEKIKTIESSLAKAPKPQVSSRQPTAADGKVAK